MQTKEKYLENEVNSNFQKLLDKFHALIDKNPSPKSIVSDLTALKEECKVIILTGHQKDAIIARCNNYANGTYGGWSKEYNVHNHVKSSK